MTKKIAWLVFLVVALLATATAYAGIEKDAMNSEEFVLIERNVLDPSGQTEVSSWELSLQGYYVMVSGEKKKIPVYPIYSESCFKTIKDRAVDVLERVCNALDCMLHGEQLKVVKAADNGNFNGHGVWCDPGTDAEHSSLAFRVDEKDVSRFGINANKRSKVVANYAMEIFEVMRTFFLEKKNPTKLSAMDYPYVKVLKRVWLDAQQHAEKIRDISPDISAQSITTTDIQEAIDMLSESQRQRLLGIAVIIPPK